jgi:uncharacterized membrane protein
MFPFVLLVVVFGVLFLADKIGLLPSWLRPHGAKWRIGLAVMFLITASGRLMFPDALVQMVPEFLPFRREAVLLSGFFEALGAVALLIPRLYRLAGLGLTALLVSVFPANINVAVNNLQIEGQSGDPAYQWGRLVWQLVLIGLVLWSTQRSEASAARTAELAIAGPRDLAGQHR